MKEWALYYAKLGLPIFPVKHPSVPGQDHPGKEPWTEHGINDASSDLEKVAGWWDKHPNANIGLATGYNTSGLLVIDLDEDDEKNKHGLAVLQEWENRNGELPETCRVITGRGGYHYFYRFDKSCKSVIGLYEGVDIRANGACAVLPPSVHENSRRYEWEIGFCDMEVADANDQVIKFLSDGTKNVSAKEKQNNAVVPEEEIIHEGERTDFLFSKFMKMRSSGLTEKAIRLAINEINSTQCKPPLTTRELEKTIFTGFKRDYLKPTMSYEQEKNENKRKVVCDRGKSRPVKAFKPIQSVTAAELDKMDIPPIEWIVEKVLPVGLSMIGAPSKYYKSYMALGLCVAICNGGKFLDFDCHKHACLYLDLESTKRRPKSRLNQIIGPFGEKPDNLHIITGTDEPGRIGDGFEKQIEYQLQAHPDIKLIIVDVFQMIRQPAKKNQSGYDRDYDDFKVLKQIADKHNIGLMLIHHTRKMRDPSDVFNELSGSVGVMGALDCAWVITKDDRYSEEGTLHITGRDMESQKLKIRFNKKSFQWEYVGTEEDVENQRLVSEYEQSPIVETIKKLVKQGNGRWEGSASEIKNASKYLSWEIYDTPQKIGSLINKYEVLLHFDRIDFKQSRDKKSRKYIFIDTNVINVTNDTNVINVTEQMTMGDKVTR